MGPRHATRDVGSILPYCGADIFFGSNLFYWIVIKLLLQMQDDFFGELQRMLSEMPEASVLHPVPEAHVPVLKFKFSAISIDLLYAKLSLSVIPELCACL